MKEPTKSPQKRISPWILGAFVLISLTVLIMLQTSNLWKDFSVQTASDTLLLYALSSLNFIAFVIFGFIFLRSIIKLARERRAFQLGAKIKTRLLLYFFMISLLPIVAMAGFSYLFMNRALERWFTQIPEDVVREARHVQDRSKADRHLQLLSTAKMLAVSLEGRTVTTEYLKSLAEIGDLSQIEIVSAENEVIANSGDVLDPIKHPESATEIAALRSGNFDDAMLSDGNGIDAAVARFPDGRKLVIVPKPLTAESVNVVVDQALAEFDRLKDKQITVRQVGLLTLGVLTFLLIFASSWTAFYIARGLTAPIKALAEGADEIAQGNFAHRVEVLAEDELALLVANFNQMSARLEANSAEIRERQKYIETILESLPTGIISFDSALRLTTINRSAVNLLKLEHGDFRNFELAQIVGPDNEKIFRRVISRAMRIGHASEQTRLEREHADGSGDQMSELPVSLTATALADGNGAVLVIEDLSDLISAQRASAWQEVARRMAHEIKNPLTPIQLSAERIAKRFPGENHEADSIHETDGQTVNVIQSGTTTILREVESLKSMVDEFSRYARLPNVKLEPGNVNDVIEQATALYDARHNEIMLDLLLGENIPLVLMDAEQLKRVFVNLIENSIEAFPAETAEKHIVISSKLDQIRDIIFIEVSDNGKGFSASEFSKIFQPYYSTKGRGTGLGLAIVQQIIAEHGGKIRAAANKPNGAKFTIEIPVNT